MAFLSLTKCFKKFDNLSFAVDDSIRKLREEVLTEKEKEYFTDNKSKELINKLQEVIKNKFILREKDIIQCEEKLVDQGELSKHSDRIASLKRSIQAEVAKKTQLEEQVKTIREIKLKNQSKTKQLELIQLTNEQKGDKLSKNDFSKEGLGNDLYKDISKLNFYQSANILDYKEVDKDSSELAYILNITDHGKKRMKKTIVTHSKIWDHVLKSK